jgi:hypothetical protein
MDLIADKFTYTRVHGYVNAKFALYHDDLCDYVGRVLGVMTVCCQCLGGSDALTYVGRAVDRAAAGSLHMFVPMSSN